jgi:hypothetical protein
MLVVHESEIEHGDGVIGWVAVGSYEKERSLLVRHEEIGDGASTVRTVEDLAEEWNFPKQDRDCVVGFQTALVEIASTDGSACSFR